MKIYRIICLILAALVALFTLAMMVNAIVDQPTTDGEAFGWGLGNVVLWMICMLASIPSAIMGVIGFILTLVKQARGTRRSGIITYLATAFGPALVGIVYLVVIQILAN